MKRTAYILLMILVFISRFSAYGQLTDVKKAELNAKMEEYFEALKFEGTDVQKQECDFLIESCTDSLTRQFVAIQAYSHYLNSPVMGAEAVAIHILDEWFFPGKVKMTNDLDLLNARVYADFNRQSLIGCKAPAIEMIGTDGSIHKLFGDDSKEGTGFKVLFFYDADCAKCKLETSRLSLMLEGCDYPVKFYAVYSGDNKVKWQEWIDGRFGEDSRLIHLWDPELDSDFQRKYGVLQTPAMFLIAPDGIILGRKLDTAALTLMLDNIFQEVELVYGSEESTALYDSIFESKGISPSAKEIDGIADYIESKSLPQGDTTLFRQMIGDMLYYLAGKKQQGYKEGLDILVNEKILSRGDIWKSADDSMKVVGFAEIMADLLNKSRPGTRIADLDVPGTRMTRKKTKEGTFRLRKLKGDRNIIIFYTEGCHICDQEKAAAEKIRKADRKTTILTINMDRIMSDKPELASALFDSMDLTSLPYILETAKDGTITQRYVSLAEQF